MNTKAKVIPIRQTEPERNYLTEIAITSGLSESTVRHEITNGSLEIGSGFPQVLDRFKNGWLEDGGGIS